MDVPEEELVDRFVPLSGEFLKGCRVPPVGVEVAVCQFEEFGVSAQQTLKHKVEQKDYKDLQRDYHIEDGFEEDFPSVSANCEGNAGQDILLHQEPVEDDDPSDGH